MIDGPGPPGTDTVAVRVLPASTATTSTMPSPSPPEPARQPRRSSTRMGFLAGERGQAPGSFGTRDFGLFRTGRNATALSRRTGSGRTGPPARGCTPYDRTVILRCTRKLLTVLGPAVAGPAPAPDPEDWYANLLCFDQRACLLLTHSATLFTIFEADVTASSLRATRKLLTDSARGYRPPIELTALRLAL